MSQIFYFRLEDPEVFRMLPETQIALAIMCSLALLILFLKLRQRWLVCCSPTNMPSAA